MPHFPAHGPRTVMHMQGRGFLSVCAQKVDDFRRGWSTVGPSTLRHRLRTVRVPWLCLTWKLNVLPFCPLKNRKATMKARDAKAPNGGSSTAVHVKPCTVVRSILARCSLRSVAVVHANRCRPGRTLRVIPWMCFTRPRKICSRGNRRQA